MSHHHEDPLSDPHDASFTRLFLGESTATRRVREFIRRAARVDAPVLITGESGVGKELVAREIHLRSVRREGPFVPLNCAAIPETMIEAELFGHERGAFTDAVATHRGAFEQADTGTLFLDEVGDLSPASQPKLLRVLESSELQRVGAESPRRVDLRIVAATNHDLKAMCCDESFRSDLYFRLRVLGIKIPPLRERVDDIRLLADHFAHMVSRKVGRDFRGFTEDGIDYLKQYPWPGNARELKGAVERALALSSETRLSRASFELDPLSMPGTGATNLLDQEWKKARQDFELAYARNLLKQHRGNVADAAEGAGVALGTLYKMMRRLGIPTPNQRDDD